MLKVKNFHFLDAPVSGGQAGAENGALTVMIGGDDFESFKKASPIIDCYSKKMKLLGPAGNGQLAKMVNQICIAGVVQGLSEAINFGLLCKIKDGRCNRNNFIKAQPNPGKWRIDIKL